MWLTERGSGVPFAVVATTSEAWLDADQEVSFDDSMFGSEPRDAATDSPTGKIEAHEQPTCPRCGSDQAIPIAYGLPTLDMAEASQRGEFALGGCIVMPENPTMHCTACCVDFGRLGDEP